MKSTDMGELNELWPEGWLGRRYSMDPHGRKKLGSLVYVIPRKAQNSLEIFRAASFTALDKRPLQVIWYWGEPDSIMVEPAHLPS